MRQVNLGFICIGFVMMSCTLEDPLMGHCGNNKELGHTDCQCVTGDTEYSSASWSYEKGASYDNLDACRDPNRLYAKKLDPGDTGIYICRSYTCAIKQCPDGKKPDADKRECVEKPEDCDGEYEVHDSNGACVCDKNYVRFGNRCLKSEDCTGKRVNNGDGTCTCYEKSYAYMYGDCFTIGDIVTFGRYPQNEANPEPSPLTWQILELNDDSALLISKYVLEQYPYHDQKEDITWEWSNVRSYLNGFDGTHNKNGIDHTGKGFIDFAFTPAERKQIKTVMNKNPDAPEDWNSTPGGNDTEDKVFLLSYDEALKYFPTNKLRIASPTPYALHPPTSSGRNNLYTCPITCSADNSCACSEGTWGNNTSNVHVCSNGQCGSNWWLRAPRNVPDGAARVEGVGVIGYAYVSSEGPGLRPALYVDLSSEF